MSRLCGDFFGGWHYFGDENDIPSYIRSPSVTEKRKLGAMITHVPQDYYKL
jgi:hypothetical protein